MLFSKLLNIFHFLLACIAFTDQQLTARALELLSDPVDFPYIISDGPHKGWVKYWSGPQMKSNAELLRFELEGTYSLLNNGSVIISNSEGKSLVYSEEMAETLFGDLTKRKELFKLGSYNIGQYKFSDLELLEYFKESIRDFQKDYTHHVH